MKIELEIQCGNSVEIQWKFSSKKWLTNAWKRSILVKVMKITDRKVGIHLTSARASDPGS